MILRGFFWRDLFEWWFLRNIECKRDHCSEKEISGEDHVISEWSLTAWTFLVLVLPSASFGFFLLAPSASHLLVCSRFFAHCAWSEWGKADCERVSTEIVGNLLWHNVNGIWERIYFWGIFLPKNPSIHPQFFYEDLFVCWRVSKRSFFLDFFQDALVQANERNGLKGFKRQLSGRFKRLISRKPHEPSPVIPPELKPQLKTIYVY